MRKVFRLLNQINNNFNKKINTFEVKTIAANLTSIENVSFT